MDDLLKKLAIGAGVFLVLKFSLERQIRTDVVHEARKLFGPAGRVRASLHTRSPFELFGGTADTVTLWGEGLKSDRLRLPIGIYHGWQGRIRHLRLVARDSVIAGLPVSEFHGEVPFVRFDVARAVLHNDLGVSGAAEGSAAAIVPVRGLQAFVQERLKRTLSDVTLTAREGELSITAHTTAFGLTTAVSATGTLQVDAAGKLYFVPHSFALNGRAVPLSAAEGLFKLVNPVLDPDRDFDTAGLLRITGAQVQADGVTLTGALVLRSAR